MSTINLSRIIHVSFWALLNALSLRLLNLASMYLSARYLAPHDFGSLSLILNTAQTWSIFLGAGIGLTLSKYVSEYKTTSHPRAASLVSTLSISSIFLAGLVLFLSIIFSKTISIYIFKNSLSEYDVILTVAWLFILTHQTAMQGAVSGLEEFKKNALLSLFGGFLTLFLISAVVPHERVWILASLMLGNVTTWLLTTRLVFSKINKWKGDDWLRFDISHIRAVVRFGLPMFIGGLIISQSQWLANLELSKSRNGLSELAGLNISLQWYAIILFIPGAISNAMLPLLSTLSKKINDQIKLLLSVFFINLALSIAMSATAFLYSKDILMHYGNQYSNNSKTFTYLCIAAAINGASSIFTQQMASHGKGVAMLYINIIWGVAFLTTIYIYTSDEIDSLSISTAYIFSNLLQAISTIAAAYLLTRQRIAANLNKNISALNN